MLFKEVITVYTDNHTEPQLQNTVLQIIKIAGIYNYLFRYLGYIITTRLRGFISWSVITWWAYKPVGTTQGTLCIAS
jgi:hypothetical protein